MSTEVLKRAKARVLEHVKDWGRPEWWRGIGFGEKGGVPCVKLNIRSKGDETEAWWFITEALRGDDSLRTSAKFWMDPVGDIVTQDDELDDEPVDPTQVYIQATKAYPFGDNPLFKAGFEAGWKAREDEHST